MNSLWAKILAGVLVGALLWAAGDRFHQAALVKQLRADRQACADAAKSATAPLAICPVEIQQRVTEARARAECDAALSANDLYAIRATCGEQTKRLQAELAAANTNLADARARLAQADQGAREAAARGEARGRALADKEAKDVRTIDAAPLGADGRVRCDAACLRALAGDGRAQAKP